jgi:hypothetical protein
VKTSANVLGLPSGDLPGQCDLGRGEPFEVRGKSLGRLTRQRHVPGLPPFGGPYTGVTVLYNFT